MINIIKNEITKIFKKKSIYVMLIITFAFIILTNVLYKFIIPKLFNASAFDNIVTESVKNEMKNLNINNPQDVDLYITDKTILDTNELLKKYDTNSWQYVIIQEKANDLIYNINYYMYKVNDSELLEEAKKEYNNFIELLDEGNWKVFVVNEIESLKQNDQNEMVDLQIELLQMRLDYNIEYGNNYKNDALLRYFGAKQELEELEQIKNKTYKQKVQYQELKEEVEKSIYVIKNDKDIISNDNTRGMLLNIFSEYGLFIVITVVLIGGTIVSEEFNKGTIKLLLVKPYSRNKILFSKFIAVLLTILFMVITVLIMQFIIGIMFYGSDSLKIPQVIYNFNTGKIEEINLFSAIIKEIIGKLPLYILIGTLAFTISATLNNTAVAITISILGYMASNIINEIMYSYNVKWIKYFITPNWDLTQVFNGRLHAIEGINLPFSIIICLIYFLIMIIPSFIVFKKKNIKNI